MKLRSLFFVFMCSLLGSSNCFAGAVTGHGSSALLPKASFEALRLANSQVPADATDVSPGLPDCQHPELWECDVTVTWTDPEDNTVARFAKPRPTSDITGLDDE